MTTEATEGKPARFALDESKAAEWLAADVAKYEAYEAGESSDPAEVEIGPDYDPQEQYDGHDTQSILYYARANGCVTGPGSVEFDYVDDGDAGYTWLVYLDGPGDLKLSTYYAKMKHLGEGCGKGAPGALGVLRQAVRAANGLLDDLAAYIAAQSQDAS